MRPAPIVVLATLLAAAPAHAHSGTPIPSAYGTAVIDGVKSPGEWDTATPRAVFTGLVGSQLYVMNNGVNLYLGLFVTDPTLMFNDIFWARFDSGHDGIAVLGDDEINTSSTFFFDAHYTGEFWAVFDPHSDGSGHATATAGGNFFEIAHPLNDGDPQDLFVNVGDTIGVCVSYSNDGVTFGSDVYPAGCLEASSQSSYVDYVIAHGPVDVGRMPASPTIGLALSPNPLRAGAELTIGYHGGVPVHFGIYSIAGRKLVDLGDGDPSPGEHVLRWTPSGAGLGSGVYFVRARFEGKDTRGAPLIIP